MRDESKGRKKRKGRTRCPTTESQSELKQTTHEERGTQRMKRWRRMKMRKSENRNSRTMTREMVVLSSFLSDGDRKNEGERLGSILLSHTCRHSPHNRTRNGRMFETKGHPTLERERWEFTTWIKTKGRKWKNRLPNVSKIDNIHLVSLQYNVSILGHKRCGQRWRVLLTSGEIGHSSSLDLVSWLCITFGLKIPHLLSLHASRQSLLHKRV